jgi:outer membrane protein assembly factor BamA
VEKRVLALLFVVFSYAQDIETIRFEGNNQVDSDDLTALLSLEEGDAFKSKLLDLDVVLVRNYYFANGFLSCTVEALYNRDEDGDYIITFRIREGPQIKVSDLQIVLPDSVLRSKVIQNLQPETAVPLTDLYISSNRDKIADYLQESGYPSPAILIDFLTDTLNNAIVFIDIDPGVISYIDSIRYSGLVDVNPNLVSSEIDFKEGDIYRLSKINQSYKNLYATGLFDYVGNRIALADSSAPEKLLVEFFFKEVSPVYLELKFGSAFEENLANDLSFSPGFAIGHNNIGGKGRRVQLAAETEFAYSLEFNTFSNSANKATLQYLEPRVFGTRMNVSNLIGFNQVRSLERLDYDKVELQTTVSYQFAKIDANTGISVQNVITREDTIPNQDNEALQDTKDQDFIFSVWANFTSDTRKQIANPIDGAVVSMNTKYAYSIPLTSDNPTSQYIILSGNWNRYQPLNRARTFVYATRIMLGGIYSTGESGYVPVTDRLYLGGANSIRGIKEQTAGPVQFREINGQITPIGFGGKMSFVLNNELRYLFYKFSWFSLGTEAFIDIGNVWEEIEKAGLKNWHAGVGLGALFYTDIGVIRLDYAANLNRRKWQNVGPNSDQTYTESPFQFHFGINFAF